VDIQPPPNNTYPFKKRRMSQRGFFSPLGNLANVLLENYSDDDGDDGSNNYDGVLYFHDDSILNVEMLAKQYLATKHQRTTSIIGTDLGRPIERTNKLDRSYEDPVRHNLQDDPSSSETQEQEQQQWTYTMKQRSYRIYPRNTTHPFTDINGQHPSMNYKQLQDDALDDWPMRTMKDGRCMVGQYKLSQDPLAEPYYEFDKSSDSSHRQFMLFPSYTQADFLYVPMRYAKPFHTIANLHNNHGIWIECSISSVVYQLSRLYRNDISVSVVPLCTEWDAKKRGKSIMIEQCLEASGNQFHGFFHPIKPSLNIDEWERLFDIINKPWIDQNTKTKTKSTELLYYRKVM
jgi:hypothetical protein